MDRMRKVDSVIETHPAAPRTWRLHPLGYYVKLVRQPDKFDPNRDRLLPGIYLPLSYLDGLPADESTLNRSRGTEAGLRYD